ncbi:hypothetical protein ACLB2K_057399 [Fragaria x ananassa]
MKVESDHYRVLDLPSGKEGIKLNDKQITKAYRRKALQLHPDKRPNDPNANAKFQRLQSSYATLMDPHARRVFNASLLRLNNKPCYSKPKKQTSSSSSSEPKRKSTSDEPENEELDILSELRSTLYQFGGFCCYMFCVFGPMTVPVWVTAAVAAGLCLSLGIGCWVFGKYIEPNRRPSAARAGH